MTYGQVNNWQSGSSTISNFPSGLWRLPVLYSAAKVLNEKLVGYQGLTSNTLSLPSLPTKPALEFSVAEALSSVDTSKLSISMPEYVSVADPTISSLDLTGITVTAAPEEPSFIYEDASLQEAFQDLSVNLQSTLPSYLAPVLVFPDAPTISNLTIISEPPTPPLAPSFSTPDINTITTSSTTISNIGIPPTYISPTTTISGQNWAEEYPHAQVDVDTAITAIATNVNLANGVFDGITVPPTPPASPSFSTPDISSTFVSNQGTPPQYVPPVMITPEFSTVDTLIETDEDIELAGVKIQEISAQISEYSSELQNRLNVFNEENAEYQGKLQEAIQQAQINAQEAQQEANLLLQKEQQEYASNLQKFSAEVQDYQAKIGGISTQGQGYIQTAQGYANEVQTKLAVTQTKVQEYQIRVQDALNAFNDANVEYQAKLQEATQQAQINAQKAQQDAQLEANEKQQEANLLLQQENQEYAASLQKYNAEVQAYQANVSKEVQEYQQNLAGDIQVWQAERTTDLQKYGSDIQSALNAFNEENTKYQVDFQEAMKDFDGKLNRKLETMRQSTSVDLQNKAQRVQAQSGLYSARLQQYGTELQEFQAKVNREVQLYSLNELQYKLVKWQTDVSTNINAYQARAGAEIQSHAAEISAMSSITQTEAAHLGARLQHESSRNTTKLNDYTGRIQEYAQAAQTEIARFNALMQEAQVQYQWYERQLAVVKEEYERGFEPFIRRENNAQQ